LPPSVRNQNKKSQNQSTLVDIKAKHILKNNFPHRNSLDDPVYERIKRGELDYLDQYSLQLNSLLRLMVHPDPAVRPTATKLLAHPLLNPTITKSR